VNQEFLESRWAMTRANRVNDSKQLTPAERDELWFEFETLTAQRQIHAHFGVASVEEIENFNILGATKLAMRRALEGIYPPSAFQHQREPDLFASPEEIASFQPTVSCRVLVDGLPLKSFPYPHEGIINGDARSLCIAMASIIAKVTRDRLMNDLDVQFPGYGFAQHKGSVRTSTATLCSSWAVAFSTGSCSSESCCPIVWTPRRWISWSAAICERRPGA
jgi:ribonuclease HII